MMGDEVEKYYLPGKDSWHNFDVVGEAFREAEITAALGRRPRLDEEIEEVFEAFSCRSRTTPTTQMLSPCE